ncbi:MAG: arylsulfatase [Phycisphaerae bacterium]|nr:arylsulfatase [Phycisphaerae bacterium]
MTSITRRNFLKISGTGIFGVLVSNCKSNALAIDNKIKPNIIFILADDLGYAEVGCYGQKKIKTPNIDKLAKQGMKFTQHYSGNPVCAPSRCTLITGMHNGHGQVRGNKQVGGKEGWKLGNTTGGQYPLAKGTVTIANLLKKQGYATGAFGKWGLGIVDSTGDPQKQGFDHFYGYICQRQAHTYYPNHLWNDGKVERIPENDNMQRKVYSHDLISQKALDFVRKYKDQPFFCYVPSTIPHVALQVPEENMKEYKGKWPETPFKGNPQGYTSQETPRAAYAAMVTTLDKEVGRMMDLVKELGIEDNTIFIFSSDNGPTFNGGSDSKFFESAGPFRGLKCSVYEGGIRVPMIVRWPGKIKAGSVNDHISAFWDFMPTLCDATGSTSPSNIDGISMLPTWLGKKGQKQHEILYWELGNQQAIRMGNWKAVRMNQGDIKLYDLSKDIHEDNDVRAINPDITRKMEKLFVSERTECEAFPLAKPKTKKKK